MKHSRLSAIVITIVLSLSACMGKREVVPEPAVIAKTGPITKEIVIEKAVNYEKNLRYHGEGFHELAGIATFASGNFENIMKCIEAVKDYGYNTVTIVALADYVSSHEEPVPHFDELLVIAAEHVSESATVRIHMKDYISGKITFTEFADLVKPCM